MDKSFQELGKELKNTRSKKVTNFIGFGITKKDKEVVLDQNHSKKILKEFEEELKGTRKVTSPGEPGGRIEVVKEDEPTLALRTEKKQDNKFSRPNRPVALSFSPTASVTDVASNTKQQHVPSVSFASKKKQPQRPTKSTRPPRMKSTRIDHFFWKK